MRLLKIGFFLIIVLFSLSIIPSIVSGADFIADPTSGMAPLTVTFTDTSPDSATGWAWYFGDETYTGSWSQVPATDLTARVDASTVATPDGSIVLMGGMSGGYKNDVWRSTDYGATWTMVKPNAAWSARSAHSSVVTPDGSIVLMGGADNSGVKNDTWRSTDNGETWTLMNASSGWAARNYPSSLVLPDGSIVLSGGAYDEGLWGGLKNDVWRSTDYGATWTMVNSNAEWSARYTHSSVAMADGSIVLMGGYDSSLDWKNDVWRSKDYGVTWTPVNLNAEWSARECHSSITMPDNSIVMMGGSDRVGWKNDVWRSKDYGATWTQANPNAGWSMGGWHSSVLMPGGKIIMMGVDGSGGIDVWYFTSAGSSEQNPIYTYTVPGIYPVALQAYKTEGSNSIRKNGYITVTEKNDKIPVILVHGIREGPEVWNDLITKLDNENIPYYNFGYGQDDFNRAMGDPRTYAMELQVTIEDLKEGNLKFENLDHSGGYTGKFDIVCHSMGALVSRWYIEKLGGQENIRQWIGIAPATGGSAYADQNPDELVNPKNGLNIVCSSSIPHFLFEGAASEQLKTNSDTVTNLSDDVSDQNIEYQILVGINKNKEDNFGFADYIANCINLKFIRYKGQTPVMWIDENNIKHDGGFDDDGWTYHGDGVVATRQSNLKGAEIDYFNVDHNAILKDQSVIKGVVEYCKQPNQCLLTTPPIPEAHFIASDHIGVYPLFVYFTDNSIGSPTEWNWSFGDGTFSNEKNPTHLYTGESFSGPIRNPTPSYLITYDVSLTVSNSVGSDTITQKNYITVRRPVALKAKFFAYPTSGQKSLIVQFTDSSSGFINSYLWDFGDEKTSSEQNPEHLYTKAGFYTVTLTVSDSLDSDTIEKKNFIRVI